MALGAAAFARAAAGTLELELATGRVFRGLEKSESALTVSAEESSGDFYGGAFAAMPLAIRSPSGNFQDEIDLYLGRGWALGKRAAVDAGATLYHYPQGEDSYEGYVGIYGQYGSFSPACYIYRDFERATATAEVSLSAVSPLPRWPIEIEARLGRVAADHGRGYSYHGIEAAYRVVLDGAASVAIRVGYASHDWDAGARRSLVGSLAFRAEF